MIVNTNAFEALKQCNAMHSTTQSKNIASQGPTLISKRLGQRCLAEETVPANTVEAHGVAVLESVTTFKHLVRKPTA